MPEITYKQFSDHLEKIAVTTGHPAAAPVYLIYGEELLFKKTHDALVQALLPSVADKMNHERIDGANESIPNVLNRMKTFSLLSGTKVVSFQEAVLFYSIQNKDKLLENARIAFQNSEMKKAAGHVLNAMVKSGVAMEDLQSGGQGLSLLSNNQNDTEWLEKIIDYCRDNRLDPPSEKDYATQLQEAVEKGFPKKNHLIITTDVVDKRRNLFNVLKERGMVVDCTVPKGNRQVDRQAREDALREQANAVLSSFKKKLEPHALAALMELTGFDLRTFSNSLEKLALFIGERSTVTAEDVKAVLDRTKEDPIFDFTGAVSDRNPEKALFLLKALLAQDSHPLQILAALINQFRKLLLAKSFLISSHGRSWRPAMEFMPFKASVLPEIEAYDANWINMTAHFDDTGIDPGVETEGGEASPAKKKKKKEKKKPAPAADLAVAQNPGNPYPIYLTLKKADLFSMGELLNAYERLGDIDIQMKSSGMDPRILLEAFIVQVCAK